MSTIHKIGLSFICISLLILIGMIAASFMPIHTVLFIYSAAFAVVFVVLTWQ